ncbi:hypothetical protein NB710_003097 [Xanthomonas sacchari]|nr:hypothetical protein [Xanthomonas sacchari]
MPAKAIWRPAKAKDYPALGVCVYCGATEQLENEHILPESLSGDALVLPKSSCRQCAVMTSAFEGRYTKQCIRIFREVIGAPTKRPRERKDHIGLWLADREDGEIRPLGRKQEFDVETVPAVYIALTMPLPTIISGVEDTPALEFQLWAWGSFDPRLFTEFQGGGSIHLASIHPESFLRMLAKIAHCFAIAELGVGSFAPLLLDIIKGKELLSNRLIGCWHEDVPPSDALHEIRVDWVDGEAGRILVCSLRLFCATGSPRYLIVVGSEMIKHD